MASYQIDAFDKTDEFSRKPKLNTGVVSKETTIKVFIRPPIIAEKERWMRDLGGKDWRAVSKGKREGRGGNWSRVVEFGRIGI